MGCQEARAIFEKSRMHENIEVCDQVRAACFSTVLRRDCQVELPCSCGQIMREMKQEMERDRRDCKPAYQELFRQPVGSGFTRRSHVHSDEFGSCDRVVGSEAKLQAPDATHGPSKCSPRGAGSRERFASFQVGGIIFQAQAGQGYNSLLPECLGRTRGTSNGP